MWSLCMLPKKLHSLSMQTFYSRSFLNPRESENVWIKIDPKCSLGYVEYSFYNPAQDFLLSIQKVSAQSPKKNMNRYFFQFCFLPLCSSGHVECIFDNPVKKILLNFGKFFAQVRNSYIHEVFHNFFPAKCSSRHVECSFGNRAEIFLLRFSKFLFQNPKQIYESTLFSIIFFHQKVTLDM